MHLHFLLLTATAVAATAPSARTLNGTYVGRYLPEYNQDVFLGVPFAQPPLGDLRFRVPQSLNSTFNGTREATTYALECVGYGPDDFGYTSSEDCLYLNVIRPHVSTSGGYASDASEKLPVAVWIYGGGFFMGGTEDRRYNLSFIVENSVSIGQPFIGVSIGYRLSAWGFLYGNDVVGSGNTNIGLRDQRLALHWLKENIAAFGGDPDKITIWGESAGAASVGFQLLAYGGRDDKLFRGAIMESGNPIPFNGLNGTQFFQPLYNNITRHVHPSASYADAHSLPRNATCNTAIDSLGCIRTASFAELNAAINTTSAQLWYPVIDGDFVQKYPSTHLAKGEFVKVPVISGANTNEGAAFTPFFVNSTQEFLDVVRHPQDYDLNPGIAIPSSLVKEIVQAYPADICDNVPNRDCSTDLPLVNRYWRRAATYQGDAIFIANRRATCEAWAAHSIAAYCYRFNAVPSGVNFAQHFTEVAFVFDNVNGYGYSINPFQDKPQSYLDLAHLMTSDWASFIASQDPNAWRAGVNGSNTPAWPVYGTGDAARNFVFDANVTSYTERDDFRAAGISLINAASVAYQR